MINSCPCSKPKVYHITEIMKDKTVNCLDLCEDCMHKYVQQEFGMDDREAQNITPAQFIKSVFDLLNTFAKAVKIGQSKASAMSSCPKCGMTFQEVQKGGRFGCPECYQYLAPPSLIKNLHGSVQHVGKVPKRWKEEQEKKKFEKRKAIPLDFRIKGLETKMNMAAKAEKYELAATIKEALKELNEASQEIEHLKYALHTAVLDKNEERASELKTRIAAMENRFLEIEKSAVGQQESEEV